MISSHRCKKADKRKKFKTDLGGQQVNKIAYLCLSLNLHCLAAEREYVETGPHTPSLQPSTCVAHTGANQLHSSQLDSQLLVVVISQLSLELVALQ